MKKLAYLLFLIPIIMCGCIPKEKHLYSDTECSLVNEQVGVNINMFKFRCSEGTYRCFEGLYGLSCLKVEDSEDE